MSRVLWHKLVRGTIVLMWVLAFVTAAGASAAGRVNPDAEVTRNMSVEEITRTARDMHVLQLKQWADSIYFRTDLKTYPRTVAEPIYKLLMHRATRDLTPDEEKVMAGGYSNYSTYLIFERNNPVQAYPLLKRSLEIMDKYKDEGLLVVGAFTNMAHIYANFNDTVKAIEHLKTGFDYALGSSTPERAGYIYAQLLLMAYEFDRLPEIRETMRRFRAEKSLQKGQLYEYNLELTNGIEAYMAGRYDEAIQSIEHAGTHINASYDPEIYISMTLLMAADVALRAQKTQLAGTLIDSAAYHLGGYHELNGRYFLDRIQAQYYRQTGQTDKAKECEIRTLVMRDSLYNARNMTMISDLEQDLITSRYNTELRESQLQQEVLQEKNTRQMALIFVMGISSLIIITLLLFLLYKRRKLNECRYDLIVKDIKDTPSPTPEPPVSADVTPTPPSAKEDDGILLELHGRIQSYMASCPDIYSPGFSIDDMSQALQVPSKQLSRAINLHAGKNFSLFLSDYRIREACRILLNADPDNRPTIEAVAEKVGYRSRSHFSRTFKSVTGLTTTDFLRQTQRHR